MRVPEWINTVLLSFESRTESFQELEVGETLRSVRNNHGDLSDDDWKAFRAEWSAFLFGERRERDSVWGTYFSPMVSGQKDDGTDFFAPDIKNLDSATVAHWEERARVCANPVMRERYSDLVWDLKRAISGERADPEYARIAIDSYVGAADKKFYEMEIVGIQWLGRALDLARAINDAERVNSVTKFMFEFYDRVAETRLVGTWLFLFDNLYGEKFISPEEESRIIANLETMLARVSNTTPSDEGVYLTLDPWAAEAAAQRLAQHYQRIRDKPNADRVIKLYGGAFEHMARQANPMIATAWLQPVIERYKQQGLKSESEQMQVIASEKGKNIASKLKTVSVEVEVKQEDIVKLTEHLLGSGDVKDSLARIGEYFVPKVDDARRPLERLRTAAPLMSTIPVSLIGADGLPAAAIGTLDEDAEGRLHQQLARTIGFYQPFLESVLGKLKEQYSPTVDQILDFLRQCPLFEDGGNGLLRDGLVAYAEEDYIKAIHVLIPQLEHIMRSFLSRLGIPDWKTVRDHAGVTDKKSTNEVLSDPRMRQVLTENLWRYLAVVYIDKRGLNLRNDVAHGLIRREGFTKHIAGRVFHTLLAISLIRELKKSDSG